MRREFVSTQTIFAARCFAAAATVIFVWDLLRQTHHHLTNGAGRPLGDDFINYWSGAFLAWHGRAAEIYNWSAFHAFEQAVVGAPLDFYHYAYPPVLLLLTAPLAFVPYVPALALWLAAGWLAFYRTLRLVMASDHVLLFALATPAVLINAVGGQNGTWTAALFGSGLRFLATRPTLAGALLGLLIYKPQLGMLIPVALLSGRHWRGFVAATLVAGLLLAASVIGFGPDVWGDYVRNLTALRHLILEDGTGVWHRFVTVFVAARRLGASVEAAYVAQAIAALGAATAVALVWFRNTPPGVRIPSCCSAPVSRRRICRITISSLVRWRWHGFGKAPSRRCPAWHCKFPPVCCSCFRWLPRRWRI